MALVYLMFGNLWYMLPFYLVGGFGYRCAVPAHGRASGLSRTAS